MDGGGGGGMLKMLLMPLVRLFLWMHSFSYRVVGFLASKAEGGIHPKHRLMDYHRFFVDNINEGDVVLDVGCGNGALTHDIAKKAWWVVGIDLNKKNIAFAKKRYLWGNIDFICGDATKDLPLLDTQLEAFLIPNIRDKGDGSVVYVNREEDIPHLYGDGLRELLGTKPFDAIILSNVLEHIESRVEFLNRMKRKASKLLIRVPMVNRDWITLYKKELGLDYRGDRGHFTEYTFDSFKEELEDAGLEIEDYSIQFGEIWAVVVAGVKT